MTGSLWNEYVKYSAVGGIVVPDFSDSEKEKGEIK